MGDGVGVAVEPPLTVTGALASSDFDERTRATVWVPSLADDGTNIVVRNVPSRPTLTFGIPLREPSQVRNALVPAGTLEPLTRSFCTPRRRRWRDGHRRRTGRCRNDRDEQGGDQKEHREAHAPLPPGEGDAPRCTTGRVSVLAPRV